MVLDVLLALQRADASIGFRYSLPGRHVRHVRDSRRRPPCPRLPDAGDRRGRARSCSSRSAGLPIVRDLIVDTSPFWEAWSSVEPWFAPLGGG